MSVTFMIELEQETDGRGLGSPRLSSCRVCSPTARLSADLAVAHVQALALRVVADRLENAEAGREFLPDISFKAA